MNREKRIRGVNIDERGGVSDRYLGDRVRVRADQMSRAYVAFERH